MYRKVEDSSLTGILSRAASLAAGIILVAAYRTINRYAREVVTLADSGSVAARMNRNTFINVAGIEEANVDRNRA